MSIDSDDAILGDLRNLFTADAPHINTAFLPAAENCRREQMQYLNPVLLDELIEPKVKCYTRPRKRATLNGRIVWLALPYGIFDYIKQHWDKLRDKLELIWAGAFFIVVVPLACAMLG